MSPHEKINFIEEASRLSKGRRNVKISDSIIQYIREVFASGQLNPGEKLGSERELMNAFGVSKSTLREALRVLEAMGIVEIRKGLMGGVFGAQVDMKTTINSIQGFLRFESVSIYDITMVRYLLEPIILRIAIFCHTDEQIEKLLQIVRESQTIKPTNRQVKVIGFHRYLTRMTQNPILILMMDFIDNLVEDMKEKGGLGPEFYQSMNDCHERIIACIMKKDVTAAQKIIIQDILATGDAIAEAVGSAAFKPNAWQIEDG